MLQIKDGVVQSPRVKLKHNLILHKATNTYPTQNAISDNIAGGPMPFVRGIVVHQTGTVNAVGPFNSYTNKGANGAHFLIDKDGTIYQTVPLNKKAAHVGKLRTRCLLEKTCPPTEVEQLEAWDARPNSEASSKTNKREMDLKNWRDRFPSNEDSIGIEVVGMYYQYDPNDEKKRHPVFNENKVYEPLSNEQHESLYWLLTELATTFKVPFTEIFRHPVVSYKNKSEAHDAQSDIDKVQAEQQKAAEQ